MVTGLLNSRFARLFPSRLATFRREGDEVPSKTWPIVCGIELSPVEAFEYRVRHAGASTLWAVTTHAYDRRPMWSFVVTWPASGILGQERLCLAFADPDEARRWHDAIGHAVAAAVDDGVGWATWVAGVRRAADGSNAPGRGDSENSEWNAAHEKPRTRHRRGASYSVDFKVNSAKANAANAERFGLGVSPPGSPAAGVASRPPSAAKGHLLAPSVAGAPRPKGVGGDSTAERVGPERSVLEPREGAGSAADAAGSAADAAGSAPAAGVGTAAPSRDAAAASSAPGAFLSQDGLRHRAVRPSAETSSDGSPRGGSGRGLRDVRRSSDPSVVRLPPSPHESFVFPLSAGARDGDSAGSRRGGGGGSGGGGSRSPSPHRLPEERGRSAFAGSSHSPSEPPSRAWEAVHYVNGTSVFVEAGDKALGGGGALLASAVVRADPEDVFRRLVAPRGSDDVGLLWGARTVERIDAHASVVAQRVRFAGLAGVICAPRELVLLRSARRDRDGTCIVLFQSVEPDREIDWEGSGGFGPSKAHIRRARSVAAADATHRARLRREASFGRTDAEPSGSAFNAPAGRQTPRQPGRAGHPDLCTPQPSASRLGLETPLGSFSGSLPPGAALPSAGESLLSRVPLPLRDPAGWWYEPVRMRVDAAGFTVAPLLPRYRTDGESRECLLTLVIKADLGGALARDSRTRRWVRPLVLRAMLEAFATSLVTLRERVEQDRFVVRPLALEEDAAAPAAERPRAPRQASVGHGTPIAFPPLDEPLADDDARAGPARQGSGTAAGDAAGDGATLTPGVARRTASRVAFDGNSLLELQMAAARRLQARASVRLAASPSGARTPMQGGRRTPGAAPVTPSSFAGSSTRAFAATSRLREVVGGADGGRERSPLAEETSGDQPPGPLVASRASSYVHLRLDLSETDGAATEAAGLAAKTPGVAPETPADAYRTPVGIQAPADEAARWHPSLSPLSEGKRHATTGAGASETPGSGRASVEVASERSTVVLEKPGAGVAVVAETQTVEVEAAGEAPLKEASLAGQAPSSPTSSLATHGLETDETLEDAWAVPGTLRSEFWSCPGESTFKIRGPNYLTDRAKIPAGEPVFELVAVDLLKLDDPVRHVARYLPSVRCSPAPFLFVLQLMVPSSPPVSLSVTWASPVPIGSEVFDEPEAKQKRVAELAAALGAAGRPCSPGFAGLLLDFFSGDGPEADAKRNRTLKLIPRIVKGSWIIKKAVGNTPSLLGQKLATYYFRGTTSGGGGYVEVDVDLGSSSVAASITNMVLGATRSLTIDLGVLIEATEAEALPEHLLGTIRLDALDARTATYLDDSTGRLVRSEC